MTRVILQASQNLLSNPHNAGDIIHPSCYCLLGASSSALRSAAASLSFNTSPLVDSAPSTATPLTTRAPNAALYHLFTDSVGGCSPSSVRLFHERAVCTSAFPPTVASHASPPARSLTMKPVTLPQIPSRSRLCHSLQTAADIDVRVDVSISFLCHRHLVATPSLQLMPYLHVCVRARVCVWAV